MKPKYNFRFLLRLQKTRRLQLRVGKGALSMSEQIGEAIFKANKQTNNLSRFVELKLAQSAIFLGFVLFCFLVTYKKNFPFLKKNHCLIFPDM